MYQRQAVTVAQKGEVEELPLLMMSLDLLELEEGGDLHVESQLETESLHHCST